MSYMQQKAYLTELPLNDVDTGTGSAYRPGVYHHIYERIRRCLAKGLRMGTRLKTLYNITDADLREHVDEDGKSLQAGASVVMVNSTIRRRTKVIRHGFTIDLGEAIEVAYDCRHYTTAHLWSLDFTFYGIATNTIGAATSFAWCYNLILDRAKQRTGISNRHSYMMGFAKGLLEAARKEEGRELRKTRDQDAAALAKRVRKERRAQHQDLPSTYNFAMVPYLRAQIHMSSQKASEDMDESDEGTATSDPNNDIDSDDDDSNSGVEGDINVWQEDALNPTADLESELRRSRLPRTWGSATQLLGFRSKAQKIAAAWLQENDIKLSSNRNRCAAIKDRRAYKEGLRTGKSTNFRRNRLR